MTFRSNVEGPADDAIFALIEELGPSISVADHLEAGDWLRRGDAALALDVLADALETADLLLTPQQWDRWRSATDALELDPDDFDFLAPPP